MDVLTRLRGVLPRGWFPDTDAVLDAILAGAAAIWDVLLSQIADTRKQARLLTATGTWLEGRIADYLPASFRRRTNEVDADFAARAAREILRPRATRAALERLLTDEGATPFRVFEPARPADTGGYGVGLGYGLAGGYGSLLMPYQALVDAKRPVGAGLAGLGGYGAGLAYGRGGAYGSLADMKGGVTDPELYAAVAGVLPAGVTAWVRLN